MAGYGEIDLEVLAKLQRGLGMRFTVSDRHLKYFTIDDIRNKLGPIKNLIAILENSGVVYDQLTEIASREIEEIKKSITYLTT